MLGVIRTKHGFRSSNKKNRRKHAEARIYQHGPNGEKLPIELAPVDLPLFSWSLPTFNLPGLLWQVPYNRLTSEDRLEYVLGAGDVDRYLEITGGHSTVSVPQMVYDPQKFMRFIAKVAHSFTCGVLGVDGFEPVLNDFILRGHEKPRIFIGGESDNRTTEAEVFSISMGTLSIPEGPEWIAVRFRFLSYLNTPIYTAIVGKENKNGLSFGEFAAYSKPIKFVLKDKFGEPYFSIG